MVEIECMQYAITAAKLNAAAQAELLAALSADLSETELQAVQITIAYLRQFLYPYYPQLQKAMKATLAEELYKAFNAEGNKTK